MIEAPANDVVPVSIDPEKLSHSKRFWTWLSGGGAGAAIPFVDWRVQMVLMLFLIGVATYSILTMPQARAKLEKLVDRL